MDTNEIVWAAGSDGHLRGYNGDTGAAIFAGGGANETMSGMRSFNTGIAARGRIYYAADSKVYAFKLPVTALAANERGLAQDTRRRGRFRHFTAANRKSRSGMSQRRSEW